MVSSTILWIGFGLLLLLVINILNNTPQVKAARARRAEEYRRHEEQRKQKEKEETAQKAKQLENFRKQRFVVYIREKDGRKSSFEAALMKAILEKSASILPLPEKDGRTFASGDMETLKDGILALVGTTWFKTETVGNYGDGPMFKKVGTVYCDYRLFKKSENGVNIITTDSKHSSGAFGGDEEEYLAFSIVNHLVKALGM